MTEAVHAALTVARAHGLPTDHARIVRDLTNVLVHLEPAPVVARVQLTLDSSWAAHEIDAARFLARAGAPVAPPADDDVDAGPHTHDGLTVTFWRWIDHDEARADPAAAGHALRELHDAFAAYDGELPGCDRLGDALPLLPDDVRAFAESLPPLDGQAVHGDAHLRNVLWSPDGPLWSDLENLGRGPREYDLACLRFRPSADVDAAIAAYGAHDEALVEHALVYVTVYLAGLTQLVAARTGTAGARAEAERRLELARAYARSTTR